MTAHHCSVLCWVHMGHTQWCEATLLSQKQTREVLTLIYFLAASGGGREINCLMMFISGHNNADTSKYQSGFALCKTSKTTQTEAPRVKPWGYQYIHTQESHNHQRQHTKRYYNICKSNNTWSVLWPLVSWCILVMSMQPAEQGWSCANSWTMPGSRLGGWCMVQVV